MGDQGGGVPRRGLGGGDSGLTLTDPIAQALAAEPFTALLGGAGTGKTFLVKQWMREAEVGSLALAATTGIAAVNLGEGTTINALLKFFDTQSLIDLYTSGSLTMRLKKLRRAGLRRIILDEVSMLDGDQLTVLVRAVEECNGEGFDLGDLAEEDQDLPPLGLTVVGDFCLGVGVPVTYADGSIRPAEAVQVGDQLMGPDNRPRVVTKVKHGRAPLFTVLQTNGDPYAVTGNHLLALRRSKDGQRQEWRGLRYPQRGTTTLCPAVDLATASRKFRGCFVGYKAGVLEFPERPVQVDPYFLGLWLGDGDADNTRITTADEEVITWCRQYAQSIGLQLKVQEYGDRTKAKRIALTTGERRRAFNVLRDRLRRADVWRNKHIPAAYLLNSVETRLQLLAGLLDSDGCWSGNRYTITVTIEQLAREIKQLGDQLGFRCSLRQVTNGFYRHGGAWTVTIGGDTWRIPCRVARKQSKPRSLGRSRLTSVLKVIPAEVGPYVAFEVDGDHLFLLGDGTVTHNCQLPPVKAAFAFESQEWAKFRVQTLSKVWRQQDDAFVEALRAARRGDGRGAVEALEPCFVKATDPDFDGPTLLAKNDAVDRYNRLKLDALTTPEVRFPATRWGEQRTEWKQIPEALTLKPGCLVMALANHYDQDEDCYRYVNGDLGVFHEQRGSYAYVTFQRTGQRELVAAITREVTEPMEVGERKALKAAGEAHRIKDKHKVVGEITYMPLRVAYATTVHKSQGLSLDRVQVNLREPFMGSPGMAYVALSRARTLQGLRLIGSPQTFVARCTVDKRVAKWI